MEHKKSAYPALCKISGQFLKNMFRSAGLYVNAVHPAFLISNRARKINALSVFAQSVVAFIFEIAHGCNCCHCLFLSEVFASISISYLNTNY